MSPGAAARGSGATLIMRAYVRAACLFLPLLVRVSENSHIVIVGTTKLKRPFFAHVLAIYTGDAGWSRQSAQPQPLPPFEGEAIVAFVFTIHCSFTSSECWSLAWFAI